MGSICSNLPKERWTILQEGIFKTNGKRAYLVKVGEWDDYYTSGILTVYMNSDVYQKIMDGEYKIKSQPYNELPIVVYDKMGHEIDLMNG